MKAGRSRVFDGRGIEVDLPRNPSVHGEFHQSPGLRKIGAVMQHVLHNRLCRGSRMDQDHKRMPRTTNHTYAETLLGQSHDDAARRCCFGLLSDARTCIREELSLNDCPVASPVNISITRCSMRSRVGVEDAHTPLMSQKQCPKGCKGIVALRRPFNPKSGSPNATVTSDRDCGGLAWDCQAEVLIQWSAVYEHRGWQQLSRVTVSARA
jgi:hypothetical protein